MNVHAPITEPQDWLRQARKNAGLTQAQVVRLLGITQSTVSDLERGRISLDWERSVRFAALYEIPLQWILTRTERPADTLSGIAFELGFYGLSDVVVSEALVPGAYRRFEEVICLALAGGRPSPRVIEAIPALLLRNNWSHEILGGFATAYHIDGRLGWLADLALTLSERPRLRAVHLGVRTGELNRLVRSIDKPTKEDSLGAPARDKRKLPAIWKRWRITYDRALEAFEDRAIDLIA